MLMPSYGAARNPIDVTAQGVNTRRPAEEHRAARRFRRSRRDPGGAVAIERNADAVQGAELKPVIDAQNKPVVFYSYTLPSDFARRELAESGVVVLSGLTHVGVAMRRLLSMPGSSSCRRRRSQNASAAGARSLRASERAENLSEADSKALLREAGIALPDEVLVTERGALDAAIARVGFPLVMKIQSPDIAAQERGRRRARQHHDQGRGVLGLSRAAGKCAQASAECDDPGRAG